MPLRRYRNSEKKKFSDKPKSHSEVSKSQSTKPLDFRLNKAILTEKREEENFDIDSSANNSQKTVQQFCCCAKVIQYLISLDFNCLALYYKNNKRR